MEEAGHASTTSSPRSAASRVSSSEAVNIGPVKCDNILHALFIDPLQIILYLRFPAVFLIVYYSSITFGSMYVLNISLETTFEKPPYEFSTMKTGLLYIPASIGYLLASLGNGNWMDSIMAREARKAGRFDEHGLPVYRPEDRMRENAWVGAISYPLALIVYGWTVQKGVHWIVPVCERGSDAGSAADMLFYQMIALFFFGLGSMLLISLTTTMLTEFMPKRTSSGVAVSPNSTGKALQVALTLTYG